MVLGENNNGTKVVITGIGVVAPGGIGAKSFWDLLSRRPHRDPRHHLLRPGPVPLAGRRRGRLRPEAHGLSRAGDPPDGPGRAVRRGRRRRGAVADSGLELAPSWTRTGSASSSAARSAPPWAWTQEYRVVSDGGRLDWSTTDTPSRTSTTTSCPARSPPRWPGRSAPRARATVVSTGCTSGLDSVGYAVELIREGIADVMIAGATDAPISPITVACFDAIKATTPAQRRPGARLPAVRRHPQRLRARRGRGGVRPGGAASSAGARGAHIYAEIAGYRHRAATPST